MDRLFYHIVLVVFVNTGMFAQTTFVPDTNLRKFLISQYASYLDANNYIINAKAAGYTANIDCPSQQIKDLTGLWKFTGLTALGCQSNAISNLDSLEKFPNLSRLMCYQNKIAKLPDLLTLTKLSYLSCGTNQLTSIPDLSTHTPLTYLDCSRNMLSAIKGLDKLVNLQSFYGYDNKLDSLPDLSNLSKLQVLMCQSNNLFWLPGLDKLTQLTQLIGGNNLFDSLPDISNLTKLTVLMFYNCRLSIMPNVSNMKNLTQLVLNDNQLTSLSSFSGNPNLSILELNNNFIKRFPDISASKSTLNVLKISNNQLDSLPDLSSFTTLDTVYVQNNRLTFEDIIPLAQNKSILNVKYVPQDSVGISQERIVTERQSFEIILGIDKSLVGNQYLWYKNGQFYASTMTDTLLISQVQLTDSGVYSCQVLNGLVPSLVLSSRSYRLKVKYCIDLSKVSYTTTDFDCNMGGTIRINESNIVGGQKPYTYKLVGNEFDAMSIANGSLFSNLFENSYTLEVKDQTGCRTTYFSTITLKGKRGADCKQLVILGSDASPNNTLFLEEKGTAKIYDDEGQLVQSFNTPNAWDGKNKNGEFLPGYYVIDLNGKTLNVTLIK